MRRLSGFVQWLWPARDTARRVRMLMLMLMLMLMMMQMMTVIKRSKL